MSEPKILTGLRFGRLLVLEDTGERYNREILWKCICDCGNIHIARGSHLRRGDIQSCGCLQKETAEKYNELRHKYKTKSLKKSKIIS